MDTKKLGFKASMISFLVSAAIILSTGMVYAADTCQIIRVRLDRAGGGSSVRIVPENVTVPEGTCTVWINFVGDRNVRVNFRENANQCILATEAATGFNKIKLDTGEECYASDKLPIGKTASLVWVKPGIYNYSITAETPAGTKYVRPVKAQGVIEVKAEPVPEKAAVSAKVIPMDTDGDGIPDSEDKCPDTPKGATVDKTGCWALEGVVLFDFDKAVLRSDAYPLLDEVAVILEKNPEIKAEIKGYTDNTGPDVYNQWLSEKRAKAVEEYLENKGVDSSRLTAKGCGNSDPIASNDTLSGRKQNRRVELKKIK